jgi:hypothetical protein
MNQNQMNQLIALEYIQSRFQIAQTEIILDSMNQDNLDTFGGWFVDQYDFSDWLLNLSPYKKFEDEEPMIWNIIQKLTGTFFK